MQARLIELALQRGRLQERIASQRDAIAGGFAPVATALALPARLLRVGQQAKDAVLGHPGLAAAFLGAALMLSPRRVLRWSQRAWMVWRTWRTVHGLLGPLLRQL